MENSKIRQNFKICKKMCLETLIDLRVRKKINKGKFFRFDQPFGEIVKIIKNKKHDLKANLTKKTSYI